MRIECAALCIVLLIMSSTLSSAKDGTYITSYVVTIIPFLHGLNTQLWIIYACSCSDDRSDFTSWMHSTALSNKMLGVCQEEWRSGKDVLLYD
jgi:hypothetical protein